MWLKAFRVLWLQLSQMWIKYLRLYLSYKAIENQRFRQIENFYLSEQGSL